MRYYRPPLFGTLFRLEGNFSEWSIPKRLLFAALPAFMLLLIISGMISHRISQNFLHDALGRNSLLATLSQAHEMEQVLQQARRELLYLARTDISSASLAHHLRTRAETMG
ncbi:MAG: Fis family transcriptional regulator, partial [Sphingomonas hengshuiensis]